MERKETSGIGHTCKITGVSERQLRHWEEAGYISPEKVVCGERTYRRYSQDDLDSIREIKHFLDIGYRLRVAAEKAKTDGGEK